MADIVWHQIGILSSEISTFHMFYKDLRFMCWHLRIKQLCERKGFFADQFDLRTKWSVFEYQSSNLIISSVIWDK